MSVQLDGQCGHASSWKRNATTRKHLYSVFKVHRWRVESEFIFDPCCESKISLDEASGGIGNILTELAGLEIKDSKCAEKVTEALKALVEERKATLPRTLTLSVPYILKNLVHEDRLAHLELVDQLLSPLNIDSSFLELAADLDYPVCLEKMIDGVLCLAQSRDDFHSYEEWLYMLREMQCYLAKPGVAEKFYEEFFRLFLHLNNFRVRGFGPRGEPACKINLQQHLEKVARELDIVIVDDYDEQVDLFCVPDLFIMRNRPYKKGKLNRIPKVSELIAVVEVKVPMKAGQGYLGRSTTPEETSHVEENMTLTPSQACCSLKPYEKQMMKSYVPQLVGEIFCTFYEDSIFSPRIFKSPYRLGVVVMGFKVHFVGYRLSVLNKDELKAYSPADILLNKDLETDLFFTKHLDLLKKDERRVIMDILYAAEGLPRA